MLQNTESVWWGFQYLQVLRVKAIPRVLSFPVQPQARLQVPGPSPLPLRRASRGQVLVLRRAAARRPGLRGRLTSPGGGVCLVTGGSCRTTATVTALVFCFINFPQNHSSDVSFFWSFCLFFS